ncbi:hypothetical protein [Cohnella rhizosphaerae]|uniref:Uncharacterized protein n=1 Tax=Cohnella rhizosphaerae TaxID=1457232 RepID=A0A9X4KTN9_9BACL|nr:hypothetical protein [Cohnella rhizosphaerae]MDG0810061.1 hypothetical protein [Cohnella rhizosphaerae]
MAYRALMFQFPDEGSAHKACGTLDELGYEPQPHGVGRLHIHVDGDNLASALEIAQSHGGELLAEAPADDAELLAVAYALDELQIPAHTVNEDWEPAYFGVEPIAASRANGSADESAIDESPVDEAADDGSYNHFEAY